MRSGFGDGSRPHAYFAAILQRVGVGLDLGKDARPGADRLVPAVGPGTVLQQRDLRRIRDPRRRGIARITVTAAPLPPTVIASRSPVIVTLDRAPAVTVSSLPAIA